MRQSDADSTEQGIVARELALPGNALLTLAATQPQIFPVLFDSATAGPLDRWSVLAAYPAASLQLRGDGTLHRAGAVPPGAGFLDTMDHWWCGERRAPSDSRWPFRGGWVLFLGYELSAEIEPGLRLPRAAADQTVAMAMRIPAALVHDHVTGRSFAIAEDAAPALLDHLTTEAARAVGGTPPPALQMPGWSADPPEYFRHMVARAQRAIAAGDIYQANLSRGWRVQLDPRVTDAEIYRALRAANPAPFAAWWQQPQLRLMSSSPERLVRVVGERIETRPIAGTRPRSRDPLRESAELRDLLASPKERAEHVMLIDLKRNDLGRVCKAGTVRVDDFMVTESYQHVHHIVSGVSGRLRPDCSPAQVIRAVFPGGTITGCPKYRCMQLIGELEGAARGAYTGSVGYLNRDGSMDLNILIRTLVRQQDRVELRAGAGIVADSDWQHELQETQAKALGLLCALGVPA